MLIDWFTVAAQAINFLLLVALLKRFLYKPIQAAIDARERDIAAILADAHARQQSARQAQQHYQQQADAIAAEGAALLQQARQQATAERARLLQAAGADADALARRQRHSAEAQAAAWRDSLARAAVGEVLAVARQVLADLAQQGLDAQICERFVARLQGLEGSERERLQQALAADGAVASLRSATALTPPQEAALTQAIDALAGRHVSIAFVTAPALVAGVVLEANGIELAWNIADYMEQLKETAAHLLSEQDQAPTAAAPA